MSRGQSDRAQQAQQRAAPSRAASAAAPGTIARSKRGSARYHRAQHHPAAPSRAASAKEPRARLPMAEHGMLHPLARNRHSSPARGRLRAAHARGQGCSPGSRGACGRAVARHATHAGEASSARPRGKQRRVAGQAQHPRSPRPVRARRHFPRRWRAGSGHAPFGAAAAVPWGPDAAASLRHARNYHGQRTSVRLVLKA